MRVLDWAKLRAFVDDRNPVEVSAGILDDWFWTGDTVYENGSYVEDHKAWTNSGWATPGFRAQMQNGDSVEVAAYREADEKDLEEISARRQKTRKDLAELSEKLKSDKA